MDFFLSLSLSLFLSHLVAESSRVVIFSTIPFENRKEGTMTMKMIKEMKALLITLRAIVGGGVNLTNPCQDAAAFGFSPQTTRRYVDW